MVIEVMRRTKGGVTWAEAWRMTPSIRHAILVAYAEADGATIDWDNGTIKWPESQLPGAMKDAK